MLIDDKFNNLVSLQFLLRNDCEGITVVRKVQNASDEITWLTYNMIDIAFIDVNIPTENGF